MGIALRQGRAFTPLDDNEAAPNVAIVSAGLAARIWPGEDPIGKHVRIGGPDGPWRAVVGVAANIHHRALDVNESSQLYIPERQWRSADNIVAVAVRTQGDPASVARAVRAAAQGVDASQPISSLATMEQVVATSMAQRRLALLLFGTFAIVALALAVAGIYGVLAGAVTERTREIGVRAALGATPGAILGMVMLQGARLAAIGVAIGLAGALTLGRFLQSLLFGVDAADPWTLLAVAAVLIGVALAACLLPALRAVGIDPIAALRAD
jgi:putative ABC transport system permease protein